MKKQYLKQIKRDVNFIAIILAVYVGIKIGKLIAYTFF